MLLQRLRASVVCVSYEPPFERSGALLCVRLRDPSSRVARLFPPGGAIEEGEDAAAAALRETLEETGYRVRLFDEPALVARAPFTWNGVLRDVTTHYFRAVLIGSRKDALPVDEPDFNEGVTWLACTDIDGALGFDATILASVKAVIDRARAR